MSKLFTLTCLFGALTFASCSGEEELSYTTDGEEQMEAQVLSEADAAADAASEITDEESAEAFLDSLDD
ncbi:MAG: hypothetical protein O3A95_10140 [Planctomycetota bacterium]|nr:hypothetical protein [Planctomycetota bacterium]MDA1114642.1 hypothetical protein [Planctomycetota bacterium]